MNLFAVASLSLAITCSFLAIIIFVNAKKKLHYIWGLMNVAIIVFGLGTFFVGISKNYSEAFRGWQLAFLGIPYIAVFFYHTVYEFCGLKNKKFLYFVHVHGALFAFTAISSPWIVNDLKFKFDQFYYYVAGIWFNAFFFFWIIFVAKGLVHIIQLINHSIGFKRIQGQYFLIGTIIGFGSGSTTAIPSWGINIYPSWHFLVCVYAAIQTFAIFRYQLLDIRMVITRLGVFVLVYSLVLGIPFALAFGWKNKLQLAVGENWWLIPLITMTILATAGPFIYLYIQNRAEERLLKEQRDYQDSLRKSSQGMVNIKNLGRLLKLIVGTIIRTVKIEHCSIYLFHEDSENFVLKVTKGHRSAKQTAIPPRSDLVQYLRGHREPIVYDEAKQKNQYEKQAGLAGLERELEALNAELVVPSFNEEKMIAILVMGKKKSEKSYTQDDISVFSILSNQAALAIENAQFYVKMKETHQQLFKAEKMATIGTMADGLSHQINNRFHSMGFIAGDALDTIRLKRQKSLTPETKDLLDEMEHALKRIEENVKRGGEVVGGLLRYTRKSDEGFGPVKLSDVVDAALEMAQFKIKIERIAFQRKFERQDILPIKGNFTQLQEVFFNIIDNSYDAIMQRQTEMNEEGFKGTLEISAEIFGGDIKIHIRDNGMGVKKEDLQKLFTPFFTTKATSKKGTGLGLYVIRQIIEEYHGGKVEFYSVHQKGSETIITLPVYVERLAEENPNLSLSS